MSLYIRIALMAPVPQSATPSKCYNFPGFVFRVTGWICDRVCWACLFLAGKEPVDWHFIDPDVLSSAHVFY